MKTKRDFVQTWEKYVFDEGWHAWRHIDSISNEPTGVLWIQVNTNGAERFIIYYYEGNCISLRSTEQLKYILVCPVTIIPTNSTVPEGIGLSQSYEHK